MTFTPAQLFILANWDKITVEDVQKLIDGEIAIPETTATKKASKAKAKTITVNKGTEETERTISDVIFTAWRHSYQRTQKDGTLHTCKTVQVSADKKVPKDEFKALLQELQAIDKSVYYSKVSHAFVFQSPTKETERAIRERCGAIKAKMPKEHADYIERRHALREANKK